MFIGADETNRTSDLLITNQLLYQLSYISNAGHSSKKGTSVSVFRRAGCKNMVCDAALQTARKQRIPCLSCRFRRTHDGKETTWFSSPPGDGSYRAMTLPSQDRHPHGQHQSRMMVRYNCSASAMRSTIQYSSVWCAICGSPGPRITVGGWPNGASNAAASVK